MPSRSTPSSRILAGDFGVSTGIVAVTLFFLASGYLSYNNIEELRSNTERVMNTHNSILSMSQLMSMVKDAETGQRGYVITGDERYLEPYTIALRDIPAQVRQVESYLKGDPVQMAHLQLIREKIDVKMSELRTTLAARRTQGFAAARAQVLTDAGKAAMDDVRNVLAQMQAQEVELRREGLEQRRRMLAETVATSLIATLLGVFLSVLVGFLMRRANITRMNALWAQTAQNDLSSVMLGEQSTERLSGSTLKFLCEYMDAQAGAVYVQDAGLFRRYATYGVPAGGALAHFTQDEGLLGQAVKDQRSFILSDVPQGYLTLGTAFGEMTPRHLAVLPAIAEGQVMAVLELGFMHAPDARTRDLLERLSQPIGMAMGAARYRANLQNLLEETQRQAEELQSQSEELRVSNEELEEQSRALQESQSRLEQQQVELEQTNAQLEEQTQLLESQRDDLARAQGRLQLRSRELEQASQYKSDFLANMSHELRTPLNSSLILARLLADNPDGNLTDEQVRYAETIQASGNDLLTLINDILDLSKIEAGHMEIRSEPVSLAMLAENMGRLFEPMATLKGLDYVIDIAPECLPVIHTDGKRLEQVLKNLLSNAMKFTDHGRVLLRVDRPEPGTVSFTVTDTGIGISPDKHEMIFEAFRQADGTSNRKYGGTGLGLSITRELTRLLGGEISLESAPGEGSSFSICIPERYDANRVAPRQLPMPAPLVAPAPDAMHHSAPTPQIADDRAELAGGRRLLLVVEDDEPFARILYELAHELDFQCLIATTADEALNLARQYLPSAVILDVHLPDHSGLSVLDRLKHDARTRHIPVHIVSGSDYSQAALSLGAVGYMIKPVKRAELMDALRQLQNRLEHRMRRVLVVEDDPVQQDAMKKLLRSHDVETVGVSTAAECLGLLRSETFDCMVLDLSLPDSNGYALLETLSSEGSYSFPPVIVYTGRDLAANEEQQLRRYSKSIIIKGAKSPERLLDEVTLFLHQVVADLPPEQQRMLKKARNRDAVLENRHILVVEDDIRNVYALTSILEPRGARVQIARNGREALDMLHRLQADPKTAIDLVLMDVMMPEMDGMAATRLIRQQPQWRKLPVIMLTAKAMKDDQERCLEAGANDYMPKPIDVEKLLSLVRVWMPR